MADREAMAELTATVSWITVKLADANTKLVKVLSDNNTLTRQLSSTSSSSRAITPYLPRNPNDPKPQYTHYCFTHGIKSSHSSKDCNSPADNHNKNATDVNKMSECTTKWKVGGRA